MKRIILIGAFALLAACGDSGKDGSVAVDTSADSGSAVTSLEGSGDTVTVDDLSDMPPKCVELLASFLKKIEPTVSEIDWESATVKDFEAFNTQFEADSASFDADTTAAGCDKYNLDTTDSAQFDQMSALAAAEAPGTLGFIEFLKSLTSGATDAGEPIPADCDGTIAAIEPYLSKGTMQDLTMVEVTRLSQLLGGVSSNCTAEESTAFFAREDVIAFVGG